MATQSQSLTATPVNIVDTLSLAQGNTYGAQFLGTALCYIQEAAAAPSDTSNASILVSNEWINLQPDGSDGIWVWTTQGFGALRVHNQLLGG